MVISLCCFHIFYVLHIWCSSHIFCILAILCAFHISSTFLIWHSKLVYFYTLFFIFLEFYTDLSIRDFSCQHNWLNKPTGQQAFLSIVFFGVRSIVLTITLGTFIKVMFVWKSMLKKHFDHLVTFRLKLQRKVSKDEKTEREGWLKLIPNFNAHVNCQVITQHKADSTPFLIISNCHFHLFLIAPQPFEV